MKNVLYFNPDFEQVDKRKHLLYLSKSGFTVLRVFNEKKLQEIFENTQFFCAIILDRQYLTLLNLHSKTLPLIVLEEESSYIDNSCNNIENPIFFRAMDEPLDTLLETVKLTERMVKLE